MAAELQAWIEETLSEKNDAASMKQVITELHALGHEIILDEDEDDCTVFADQPWRNLALCFWWEGEPGVRRISRVEVLWQKM